MSERASLLVLRVAVVFLCAAFGAVLISATTFGTELGLLGLPCGLVAGILCGILVARRGLPYPARRLGVIFGGAYLVLVALSVLPVLPALGGSTGGASLGGVYAVIVTAPWSFVAGSLVDAVAPGLLDSGSTGYIFIGVCAVVNAALLYGLGLLTSLLNSVVKLR